MKFFAKSTDVTKVDADMLAVFACLGAGGKLEFSDEAKKIDGALGGIVSEAIKSEDFEAKNGNVLLIHTHGKISAKRILLAGLGQAGDLTVYSWQSALAGLGRKARDVGAKRLAIAYPTWVTDRLGHTQTTKGAVEGIVLGTYVFHKHKSQETQKKDKSLEDIWILVALSRLNATAQGIRDGQTASHAVVFARDLVNEPPSFTTPTHLGEVARKIAKGVSNVTCDVLGKSDMEKLGMGALLGIARGSDEEPAFIKLFYKGTGRKTICLVGKGITFDTGGLSLKKSESMETMKLDMAGAAAILGVFSVLPALAPKVNVVGLIAATENMPSGRAIKPGDVVRAMNGKTIEILNTDAEGRVILADALSYAGAKAKPDVIIDLATLTGACMVALGEEIAGIFSNNRELVQALKTASEKTGERIWELPLVTEYKDVLKSNVADIVNTTKTRYGGAIAGALFIQEFVPKGVPWAHLDIAGPAWAEKDAPLTPAGGTGFGVRMLIRYILSASGRGLL